LLLREAGINARYITGYALSESERKGDSYVVRERDGHAWALFYQKDARCWEQLDTTPSGWEKAAGAGPAWWEPVSDFCSNIFFQFSKWRWSKTSYTRYFTWLLAPLILILVWRIVSHQRRQRSSDALAAAAGEPVWPGLDSELYRINHELAAAHLARLSNEPLNDWQCRLEAAFPQSQRLGRIFFLHHRLRFDPRGLTNDDRQLLKQEVELWLAETTDHTEPNCR
jgi:protein-glutamine gamma-glutamyltransferase